MLLRILGVVIIIIPPFWGDDDQVNRTDRTDVARSVPAVAERTANEQGEPSPAFQVFPTSELGGIEILDH